MINGGIEVRRIGSVMICFALISVVTFCPLQAASAADDEVYTLQRSIEESFANNLELKAQKERITQSLFVKKQAKAEFFPKLGTSYGYTKLSETPSFRSELTPGQRFAVGTEDNYQWRGTVSQPVFTGFALVSSFELAKLGIDESKTSYEMERLDLALRVKEAYFGILEAEKAVQVAEQEVDALASHAKEARSFYDVGLIPVNDVLETEVQLSNARYNLVRARNGLRLARSAFNVTLSRAINAPVRVEDVLTYEPFAGSFEEEVQTAMENRPETKLIEIAIDQAEQQKRLARSDMFPDVYLNYDYIKEGDSADVSGSPFHDANRWEATASLTWTFWEWGKTHYAVQEKESLLAELARSREALEDSIRLEVKEAVLALQEAEENIPTTSKAIEQATENMRVSRERYKARVNTSTEVLDAQTLLTQARNNYYRALYDHHLAKARLERAVGTY